MVNVTDILPLPDPVLWSGITELPNLVTLALTGSIDATGHSALYRNCTDYCVMNCLDWDGVWRTDEGYQDFTQGSCELVTYPMMGTSADPHVIPIVYTSHENHMTELPVEWSLKPGANVQDSLFFAYSRKNASGLFHWDRTKPFHQDVSAQCQVPVSYTHLTLPTIYSV